MIRRWRLQIPPRRLNGALRLSGLGRRDWGGLLSTVIRSGKSSLAAWTSCSVRYSLSYGSCSGIGHSRLLAVGERGASPMLLLAGKKFSRELSCSRYMQGLLPRGLKVLGFWDRGCLEGMVRQELTGKSHCCGRASRAVLGSLQTL